MEQALQIIKTGGLSHVDEVNDGGGVVIKISGGAGNPTKNIITGNIASIKLRDKIIEWGAFKDMYPNPEKMGKSGDNSLCNTVKIVLDSKTCLDLDNTLEILRMIYRLSDEKLSEMFIKRFNFAAATKMAMKSIYINWVSNLENAIINYTKTRDAYLTKLNNTPKLNNVAKLLVNWNAVDLYYGINSSSPILLFSSFPKNQYVLPFLRGKYTENDTWDIMPDKFHWRVDGVKETEILEEKVREFNYLGFCPRRPKYRMKKLFEFPLEELRRATEALGGKFSAISYKSLAEMMSISQAPPVFPSTKLKRIPEPDELDKNTQKCIYWYTEKIINIYAQLKPHFQEVEKYYTTLAQKLAEVGLKLAM